MKSGLYFIVKSSIKAPSNGAAVISNSIKNIKILVICFKGIELPIKSGTIVTIENCSSGEKNIK
jgi:hypothetical protein